MKSRYVTPKFESTQNAIILSANDVIATILVIDDGEPKFIAELDLPVDARNYRTKNPEGKSMFQRGEIIKLKVSIEKTEQEYTDKEISDIWDGMWQFEDDNAELFQRIDEDQLKFAKEWSELCQRDLKKKEAMNQP